VVGCVTGLDEAVLEGAAFVADLLGVGEGELADELGAGCEALPASDAVAPPPPFPPAGLCDRSRTAATATIATAAPAAMSQPHRPRPRDGGLRGGKGGMLAPPPDPRSSGPETGTRDVSGRACSYRVAAGAPAPGDVARPAPMAGSRVVGS
jgi:hypothetical protein